MDNENFTERLENRVQAALSVVKYFGDRKNPPSDGEKPLLINAQKFLEFYFEVSEEK